jgi:SAM-dependent methyltransferase
MSSPLPPLTVMATLRWDIVSRFLDTIAPVGSVLEIGAGQGAVGVRLAQRSGRYVGVEPDATSHAVAVQRIRAGSSGGDVVHGDSSLVSPEALFDLVCAFEVLEHIDDDVAALRDWSSRIRPGGHLLISVPAWQRRFGPMDELVGHFRRYDPEHLRGVLAAAGFVETVERLYGFPLGYALESTRNLMAQRRSRQSPTSMAERTSTSGRLFQPSRPAFGAAISAVTAPFRALQRTAPGTGVGIVALARRPAVA